jgi:succinyl-diaminopimelate desuccinylase
MTVTSPNNGNTLSTKRMLWELAARSQEEWLSFSRRLIQTPSLPGQEGAVAKIIQEEMQRLGYDRVWTDKVGNVIGMMQGEGGPSLLFNGHMDVVDPGPAHEWPHPPYSAHVDDTWLWGRGASDMKAALALQIYSPALLRREGYGLPGDCFVTAVVFEETGGLGTRALLRELTVDMAVVGEASSNQIARGHRGRLELIVRVKGHSVHASVPERGANPHYSMARFLTKLRHLDMTPSEDFSASTVAPTLYHTDQTSANVVPGEAVLYLDWRNVPEESQEDVLNKLRTLLEASLEDGCQGTVELNVSLFRTYTGHEQNLPREFPGFILPADHPLVLKAQQILESRLGHEVPVIKWKFATDGAHLVKAGIPTIGFSPASELFPHTTEDRIELQAMVEGLVGYMALALELGRP